MYVIDTWTSAGPMPANHVTTVPVCWGDKIIIASGEVRPRVRSPKIFAVAPKPRERQFGIVNYIVLFGYLLLWLPIIFKTHQLYKAKESGKDPQVSGQ